MARIGQKVYSDEYGCWYKIVRGRPNNCRGCAFDNFDPGYYGEDGDGEFECTRPSDIDENCCAEDRNDEEDIIFKEC